MTRNRRTPYLRWPILILLASVGVTVVAAYQAMSAARQHRRTAEQLLHDYAAFAAWSYKGSVNSELGEGAWQVLNPILHDALHQGDRWPDATSLIRYWQRSLADCKCTPGYRPSTYFGFVLGTDTIHVVGDTGTGEGAWLNDELTRQLRGAEPFTNRMALLTRQHDGSPYLLAYGLMPTVRFDTVVYGFVFDPASLPVAMKEALDARPLLPEPVSGGRANGEIIATRVRTPDGAVLYQSPDWPEWEFTATEKLIPQYGGLLVEASVLPELAEPILGAGVPLQRMVMLGGLVLLSAALSLLALRQLRREAEVARLRSEFVASVSHELRTPLAQIRLFLETVRLRRYESDSQREWLLSHLDRETRRLGHLVENILRFARLERGDPDAPRLAPADLGDVAGDAIRDFEPLASSRRARITAHLAPGLVAQVDRALLGQAITNLLDNAVKYGPSRQEIRVTLERDGDIGRLRVADEGPGIPEELHERIWDPYFRGATDAARAVGGSGLGLAITRDAVTRCGGTIRLAESATGAQFVIELPLAMDGTPATVPTPVPPVGIP
ncbi:MAG: sensor histidine kinase [Gemmatimonadales bacterium]